MYVNDNVCVSSKVQLVCNYEDYLYLVYFRTFDTREQITHSHTHIIIYIHFPIYTGNKYLVQISGQIYIIIGLHTFIHTSFRVTSFRKSTVRVVLSVPVRY